MLEVHRPVEPDVPQPGLPALPVYVPREHDTALAQVVTAAAAGAGGIAVWWAGRRREDTGMLEGAGAAARAEPGWRLWHPIDPPGALAGLPGAAPRTVVWLNEAQRYLGRPRRGRRAGSRRVAGAVARPGPGPGAGAGHAVAGVLGSADRPPARGRGPARPGARAAGRPRHPGADRVHSRAAAELEKAGDPRLTQAAAGSRDGQVIQYLAGAPELLDRYHNAPPAAQALIDAAMDAARLGMRPALPQAFLETAAPGYLTDTDWDLLPGDWLEQGLSYTAKPCKGIRGPLAPIRPRPAPGGPASLSGGRAWQLADYLDQHGRRVRREKIPPASFWTAAASYADPADLDSLGYAAEGPRPALRCGPPVQAGQCPWRSRCRGQTRRVAATPCIPATRARPTGPPPTPASITRRRGPNCWAPC